MVLFGNGSEIFTQKLGDSMIKKNKLQVQNKSQFQNSADLLRTQTGQKTLKLQNVSSQNRPICSYSFQQF